MAAWIWELARVNFPLAILFLNRSHALERLHELCDGLYGKDTPWAERMKHTWTAMLKQRSPDARLLCGRTPPTPAHFCRFIQRLTHTVPMLVLPRRLMKMMRVSEFRLR
jgi:hypothetical protein